jgi:hypothetical protein
LQRIFREIRHAVRDYNCRRAILVGHNAAFDLGFLNAAVSRAEVKRNPFHPFSCFDTATLAGAALGQTVLAKAVTVAGLKWDSSSAHSASYDAELTADLFCIISNRLRESFREAEERACALGWITANTEAGEEAQMETEAPHRRCPAGRAATARVNGYATARAFTAIAVARIDRSQRRDLQAAAVAPTSPNSFFSSPLRYISRAMSHPPTSSPFT